MSRDSRVACIVVDDEPLARERIRSLLAAYTEIDVVAECPDGTSAVAAIESMKPELVFLDVQMPAITGLDVIDALDNDAIPVIVFVTAFDEHAATAFDLEAADYVLKPIIEARFKRAVTRALERVRSRQAGESGSDRDETMARAARSRGDCRERFVVRHPTGLHVIRADDVDWIDVASNYVRLHVRGRTHFYRRTVAAVAAELDAHRFLRVHRGCGVNVGRIAKAATRSHGEYELTMCDGARVPVSRTYADGLRALLK